MMMLRIQKYMDQKSLKKNIFGKETLEEKQNITNLTTNEKTINKVLYILRKNTVTPVALQDVLQEVLSV